MHPSSEGAKSWLSGCLCWVGARAGGAGLDRGEKGSAGPAWGSQAGPRPPRVRERFPGGWRRNPGFEGCVLSCAGSWPAGRVVQARLHVRPGTPHPAPGWEAGITPMEGSPAPQTLATASGPRGRVWGSGLAPGQLGDRRTWPAHARDACWVGGGNKKQSARQLLFPEGPGALGKPRKAVWILTQNRWGRAGVTPWLTPELCATADEAVVLSSGSL